MENITLNEENGIVISQDITPRDFDKISILYKQYAKDQIGDMMMTFEAIKLLLIDKTKVDYIDKMLDGDEKVLSAYEVLEEWTEKVFDVILKLQDRKKKSTKSSSTTNKR